MKEERLILFFVLIFIISLVMLFVENYRVNQVITGYAVETSTVSNVTISKYLSIAMSSNLSSGIQFGTVNTLPATDINASGNNNSAGGGSSFFVNVSTDSNTPVDFCIKANDDLKTAALNVLGLSNETYSNSSTTDAANPLVTNQVAITTTYSKSNLNVSMGYGGYYRFWLDIPSGTASGTYNNSVYFKGVEISTACGT